MAKTLEELAKENGFTDEPAAQEVQQAQQAAEIPQDVPAHEAQADTGTPAAPALQTVQRAAEIIKNLPVIQFLMDMMRDPEETILSSHEMSAYYPEWQQQLFDALLNAVNKQYGEDIEQMRNPATRTPEQQQYLLQVSTNFFGRRIHEFFTSNYMQALNALDPLPQRYRTYPNEHNAADLENYNGDAEYSLKECTVLYFFAKHREIRPDKPQALTDDNIAELTAMFYRIDNYFMDRTNGGKDEEPERIFFDFIEYDNPEPSKLSAAIANNALTTIGNRLFVPSDPEYQNAFITSVSAKVGLFKRASGRKKELALNINTEFMRALAKLVFIDYLNGNKSDLGIDVYFPELARELGYDINHRYADKWKSADNAQEVQETNISRTEARQQFINDLLVEIDNIWGKLPHDATEYKLISVLAYNPETEVLHFVSPYLQQLIGALVGKEAAQLDSGKHYYLWNCDLLHATAANERNRAAVEMATRILVGVQQRGLTPDAKLKQNKNRRLKDETAVTWQISCAGLIEDCPQIRERLNAAKNTSSRTQTMQRAFKTMYRILKKKTDLFNYYSDLTITEIIPSARTIESAIVVTHHGGNPNYKRPPLPLKDNAQEVQEGITE